MPRAAPRDPIYFRRRYSPEVIEQCVRWYITYRLSYRNLVAECFRYPVLADFEGNHLIVRGYVKNWKQPKMSG